MKRRSPVFHVDGETGLRGGERQLLYLAGALKTYERRNVIWCRKNSALEAEAKRLGLETKTLPFFSEADPYSAWKLSKAAKQEGAILHAHTAHAAGLCALASVAHVPYITHRRVDFPVSALSARIKYGRASRIIAVSEAIALILRRAGVPGGKITVIPDALPLNEEESSWVHAPFFRPAAPNQRNALRARFAGEFKIDPASPWIGNLAALVPHKDQRTLIAAASLILRMRPEARVLIAGEGPERTVLQTSIEAYKLSGKVLLLGQRSDAGELLQSLDIYVQSSWGEGMGSVLLEAMACGIPVAATTAGGIPEIVERDATGLLVSPRDPEALADAVLRLIDDRALNARLSSEALRRLPAFSLASMVKRADALYTAFDS